MYVLMDAYVAYPDIDSRTYIVQVPELNANIRVRRLGISDGTFDGPVDRSVLPAGTAVVICVNRSHGNGYIIDCAGNDLRSGADFSPQDGRGRDLTVQPNQSPVLSMMAGRSYEAAGRGFETHGSAGKVNRRDVGYGMTMGTAFIKASEACGVWALLDGSLLRFVSVNKETWGAFGTATERVKGFEVNASILESPFFYETLGRAGKEQVTVDVPEELEQRLDRGDPEAIADLYAILQRMVREATPSILPRTIQYKGFVGGYSITYVARPGSTHTGYEAATGIKSDQTTPTAAGNLLLSGLSYQRSSAAGDLTQASVRGQVFHKTPYIDVPKQVVQDEDLPEYTDTPDTYKETQPVPESPLSAAYQQLNAQHYTEAMHLNRAATRPGWAVDPSPLRQHLAQRYVPTTSLRQKFEYNLPEHIEVQIDPIRKEVIRSGEAFFGLLPDGGFAVIDAYGSCFVMAGGNIYTSCPGDHTRTYGRNSVELAGGVTCLRAQQDVEVVSALSNVRVKAEKQLTLSGGHQGVGGVLIESKAVTPATTVEGAGHTAGGIVLISKASVSVSTKNVYVQSPTGGLNVSMDGMLQVTDLQSAVVDTGALYAKKLQAQNASIVAANIGNGVFGGVANRAISATHAAGAASWPVPAPPVPPVVVAALPTTTGSKFVVDKPDMSTLLAPVSATVHKQRLSWPTSAEYGVPSDYRIPEAPWQQRDRAKTDVRYWVEPKIENRTAFPGTDVWTGEGYQRFDDSPEFGRVYTSIREPIENNLVIH